MNKAVARNDVAFKFWATLHAKRLALGVRTPGDRPLETARCAIRV
jgi:hypothetical protein